MEARAGWIYLASMFGVAAWSLDVPVLLVLPALLIAASLLPLLWRTPGSPGRDERHDEHRKPRRFRGDCRDIMGHEEPPVQKDAP
jgi:hypothetical protein